MKFFDFPVEFNSKLRKNVTERGEHHAIRLVCDLPPDFCGTKNGIITFRVGKGRELNELPPYVFPSEGDFPMKIVGGKLHIVLWEELTTGDTLQFCLERWTEHNGVPQRMYTPDSEVLCFTDHIGGGPVMAPSHIVAWLKQKLPLLRRLGESSGKLTFDGKPVSADCSQNDGGDFAAFLSTLNPALTEALGASHQLNNPE